MTLQSENPPPRHGDVSSVDLWLFARDIADDSEHERLAALLSPEEHERSQRFLDLRDRHRYTASRGRLREILSDYISTAPQRIQFRYGDRGKPYLADNPPIFFNLSHSAHLGAVAVSTQFEVGIDIELLRTVRRNLPARYFSATEVAGLAELEGDAWLAAFFRCWTRKEAFIKALGEGMRQPLKSFSVTFKETEPARLTWMADNADAPRNWTLMDLVPAAGFAGAIAIMTGEAPAPRLRVMSHTGAADTHVMAQRPAL